MYRIESRNYSEFVENLKEIIPVQTKKKES